MTIWKENNAAPPELKKILIFLGYHNIAPPELSNYRFSEYLELHVSKTPEKWKKRSKFRRSGIMVEEANERSELRRSDIMVEAANERSELRRSDIMVEAGNERSKAPEERHYGRKRQRKIRSFGEAPLW